MDIILSAVILFLVFGAGWYIYKAKRSGAKCIGCPVSGSCGRHSQEHTCHCSGSQEGSGCHCGK